MNKFNEKLKLIFVPFLVIAIATIAGYTFLHWLLFIKFHVFNWKEETLVLALPWMLPWVPIFIWLRPRIKLLNMKKGMKSDPVGFYIFMSGLLIAIPSMIAQVYLESATGKLTQLNSIDQIDKQEATKYYTVKHFYIDKTNIGIKSTFEVTDKYKNFDMNLYMALPVLSSPDDTLTTKCVAWYGIKYHKKISNRLSKEEKDERFNVFAQESREDLDKKDVNQFIYFDRISNSDDHDGYNAAIKNNPKYSMNSTTVLIPVNEPFAERNGHKLAWLLGVFAFDVLIWLIMVRVPKFNEEALAKFHMKRDSAYGAQPQNI